MYRATHLISVFIFAAAVICDSVRLEPRRQKAELNSFAQSRKLKKSKSSDSSDSSRSSSKSKGKGKGKDKDKSVMEQQGQSNLRSRRSEPTRKPRTDDEEPTSAQGDNGLDPLPYRVVQLRQGSDKCLGYDESLPATPLYLYTCSSDSSIEVDRWYQIPESSNGSSYKLMHVTARKCLPQNPESPTEDFDCFASTKSIASGDSINGLVDCEGKASTISIDTVTTNIDQGSGEFLNSVECTDKGFGINLMSYHRMNGPNGKSEVIMWGESILLKNEQVAQANGINGRWIVRDAP